MAAALTNGLRLLVDGHLHKPANIFLSINSASSRFTTITFSLVGILTFCTITRITVCFFIIIIFLFLFLFFFFLI